ncbi:hypothetical protein Daus18300_003876 [Diaporthe australafricana]|uniref:Heterokaryon incompatibility domain-containing protein n=1 Tax=Diaporthe australafricana TaxID=127596 RepID=A0ABR3XC31_9PEZI
MSRDLYPPDALPNVMSPICDKHIRHADGTIIKVTENLVQALKQLGDFGYSTSREHPTPNYLWIDAICINQGDNNEKSSQVSMMDLIYSNAQTVVVWLGEEDFHTPGALKTMKALAEVDFSKFEKMPFFDDYDAFTAYDTLLEAGKILGLPDIEAGEWRDYAAFLQRKWFERIWVVQEKVFAKNTEVFVGHQKLPWHHIVKAASVLKQTGLANPLQALYLFALDGYDYYRNGSASRLFEDRLNNHEIFADLPQTGSAPAGLETLLYQSKRLNATQPQDHVYAILGIWEFMRGGSLGPKSIRVDYTKPIADVYAEATMLAIEETGDLGILSLVERKASTTGPDLPSWVPDYNQKTGSLPLTTWPRIMTMSSHPRKWNSSQGLELRPQSDGTCKSSRKLLVQGFELDLIEDIGPKYQQIDREYQWSDLLQVLLNGHFQDQQTAKSSWESFWRTIIKNSFRNQPAENEAEHAFTTLVINRVQALYAQVHGLKESIQILKDNNADLIQMKQHMSELEVVEPLLERTKGLLSKVSEKVPQISAWSNVRERYGQTEESSTTREDSNDDAINDDEYETSSLLRDIESSFWAAYSGRRVFRTKMGFFGISNQALEKGDRVWILAGAETPFVLRNRKGDEWRVIGEAYVHGFMKGEAVRDVLGSLSNIVLV